MLCRAVTVEGFSKRMLYTNDEDVIYHFRRCVALNGVNVVAQKPDLLDRSIMLELGAISSERRRTDSEIWEEFEGLRPALFGAMLSALSKALEFLPEIRLECPPRMADFARWGSAIARVLGYEAGSFQRAFQANVAARNIEVVEGNPVATIIVAFMEDRSEWEGSPTELLSKLHQLAQHHYIDTKARMWPKAPHALSRRLNELLPNLAAAGLEVSLGDRSSIRRKISIRKGA